MKEETVIRLLKSQNLDDQTLGIQFAIRYLGKEWCWKELISIGTPGFGKYMSPGGEGAEGPSIMYEIEDWAVYHGECYIEYMPPTRINIYSNVKRISV